MKILNREKIDECTGLGRIIEVETDSNADDRFIQHLRSYCDVVFIKKGYEKPLFVARMQRRFVLKGFMDSDRMNVVSEKENFQDNIEEFKKMIREYE